MINRCAAIILARQPYLDWLRKLPDPVDPDTTLEHVNEEPTIFLLPQYEANDPHADLLPVFHDILFESMLAEWWQEESDWPLVRDLETFNEWFSVSFHSIIEDMDDENPLLDDIDDLPDFDN